MNETMTTSESTESNSYPAHSVFLGEKKPLSGVFARCAGHKGRPASNAKRNEEGFK
jgi:hypothetical protein